MLPVLCPRALVHGFRCSGCSWARLFVDCYSRGAVPFCFQVRALTDFNEHICGVSGRPDQYPQSHKSGPAGRSLEHSNTRS